MVGFYIYLSGFVASYFIIRRFQHKTHYRLSKNTPYTQDWGHIVIRVLLSLCSWMGFFIILFSEWETLGFKTIKWPIIKWPKFPNPPNWL